MAIIVDIIFAAREAVEPSSWYGLSSIMSTPITFVSLKEVIKLNNSLDVIPTASGLPTPGANAGSSTSRSKLE